MGDEHLYAVNGAGGKKGDWKDIFFYSVFQIVPVG
jgi:hypothetical protein